MSKKLLQIQQLDHKMQALGDIKNVIPPSSGWVKAIRNAIGMSMLQLGNRMSITKQSIQDIERREKKGSITINALKEVANAMDMQLVYGFVPKDGSLAKLIDKKVTKLATEIVMRTNNTMQLEDQAISQKRIEKAILERANEIKNEMPKALWD
ncbi:MAG: hypothetical protein RL135_549 [Bacteroidota bacterium]|jgi:predicted DNA-binding mobile mystery protein A